jgi:cyclopropane fatty-acyl-phospholipid synthase-like methyltransferase
MTDTHYENTEVIAKAVQNGGHRAVVGGLWDQLGLLQFQMMQAQGLRPAHRLLDIGCGALRGGRYFIPFLEPFHYFGTDLNRTLIDAGLDHELGAEQRLRLGPQNLMAIADFSFPDDLPQMDFALAFSLFTHLSDNKIALCLENLRPRMAKQGALLATVFRNDTAPRAQPVKHPGGITTWSWQDPYHQSHKQLSHIADQTGWRLDLIRDFNHPRHQQLCRFSLS